MIAEPLHQWLTESIYKLNLCEQRRVVVVAIVGKESGEHSKVDVVNSFLQRNVFASRWKGKDAKIDAFFASEYSAVFLHLQGYGDMCNTVSIFADGEKSFFERVAESEADYVRCLLYLLTVSHIILCIEPCCRFDLNFCRFLMKANALRLSSREAVCAQLGSISTFPREWAIEGRLARPRLLFCFQRNPLRPDLGLVKKKELVRKLEQSMESQIYDVLRLHKVIGNGNKSYNCGSVPPEGSSFVYIFSAKEGPRDIIKDMIVQMVESLETKENEEEDRRRRRDDGFGVFLKSNIDDIRKDPDRAMFYEIPKLKWYITGSKLVYDMIFKEKIITDREINNLTGLELQFSQSMGGSYISLAKAAYNYRDARDLEKRKPIVYSKREHEIKLARAMERLESIYHGPNLEKAKADLKEECEAIWMTQKACEAISLTGNECVLPVHYSPSDLSVPAQKRIPHSSAARFLSTCNCGHSQALRADPFTTKEANYDFYEQPIFVCCRNLERYAFAVFEQTCVPSADAVAAPSGRSQLSEEDLQRIEHYTEPSLSSTDAIEMLLDRDNCLDARNCAPSDEVSRSKHSSDSSSGDENSVMSEMSDERESSGEVEETADDEKGHPGMRRPRAHMDGYSSSLEENESAGGSVAGQTSYLDDDEILVREDDRDADDKLQALAVSSEEELAAIRMNFRDQFLECVPNTESPSRLPLFPSWSLVCLGPSSVYSHKVGLRDMPNFKSGSHFLLPVDIYLIVDPESWDRDMKDIIADSISHRPRRPVKQVSGNREKVKLFIGFEFECPRGHRFMIQDAQTPMRGMAANSKENGAALLHSDIPLWMPCTCRRAPQVSAQLMRLHVVTPKAPVTVTLSPFVQPTSRDVSFHSGEGQIHLEWAKYYVLRFPYIYDGAQGPIHRPAEPAIRGKLLANSIQVQYIPMH